MVENAIASANTEKQEETECCSLPLGFALRKGVLVSELYPREKRAASFCALFFRGKGVEKKNQGGHKVMVKFYSRQPLEPSFWGIIFLIPIVFFNKGIFYTSSMLIFNTAW